MPSINPARLDVASRAAALSFGANVLLMVVKITVGLVFGSVAVLGDGIDSAEDVFASALAFFTVRLALQPADQAHPYGHGKTESLAALSQALLIGAGAGVIAVTAGLRFGDADAEILVAPSLATMFVTVAVNLAVAAYAFRAARISGSVAIASDARHLMTNVVQAAGVIAALALVGITGNHVWDPLVALLLAAYLGWTAFGILRVALMELIDTSLPDTDIAQLEACLAHEEHGVRGYHELRTRKSGREKYIDVHVLIDPEMSVSDAHRRVEEIVGDLEALIPGAIVSIHVDPDEPGIMAPREQPERLRDDPGLHLHRH
jgi:cation diffusion facilitator family transporter